MRAPLIALTALLLGCGVAADDPLAGSWQLERSASVYSPSAHPRRQEQFECDERDDTLHCAIDSTFEDGSRSAVSFTARYGANDITPVSGDRECDGVRVRRLSARRAQATFYRGARPLFAYATEQSPDGSTLIIRSLDPKSGRLLRSQIVYRRIVDDHE